MATQLQSLAGGAWARLSPAVDAHARHRHERLRSRPGTRANEAALKVMQAHQHGSSKLPLRAGTHPFGAPHRGHVALGSGRMGASVPGPLPWSPFNLELGS